MTEKEIDALLQQYEPRIREAFLAAIAEITNGVILARVIDALQKGDINAAADAISVDPRAFSEISLILSELYFSAGKAQAKDISESANVNFWFNFMSGEAVNWVSAFANALIARIVSSASESIIGAIRDGIDRGDGPQKIVLDVVGRKNMRTGRRDGGVIGLTEKFQSMLSRAKDNLKSAVPEKMKEYLGLSLREKKMDGLVSSAIRGGRALTNEEVIQVTHLLAKNALNARAALFSGHAARTAIQKAQDDALWQAVRDGLIDADLTTKTWNSQKDNRVRRTHTHVSLDGQTVPFSQPFVSISGVRLRYPYDPDADVKETIGCRCFLKYNFRTRRR